MPILIPAYPCFSIFTLDERILWISRQGEKGPPTAPPTRVTPLHHDSPLLACAQLSQEMLKEGGPRTVLEYTLYS